MDSSRTPAEEQPQTERTPAVEPPRAAVRRPRARRAAVLGLVLVLAAFAGTGLGMAVAVPGWLPGPSAAPGPAQPSYVVDSRATPSPTQRSVAPDASPIAAEYSVEAGDTLRSIADKLYGDADLWPSLYDANREIIGPDPDALLVGMRLRVPAR
ncbi:MAG: LysM peptidoglycan-binding domain-containing protein [Chloroflexota bacterium]